MSRAAHRSVPPAPGPIRPFVVPEVDTRRLDNGLALWVGSGGRIPIVTVAVVVDAGATTDPADCEGLAYLAANALEVGTANRSAQDIAWDLEYLGVELAVDVGWDAAAFGITVPRERLDPAVELLAELVRRPAFPESEVERLRDQQLAALQQRTKEPRALANDAAMASIFAPGVPFARPLIGKRDTVATLNAAGVRRFHGERYLPGAAGLFLVGDIGSDEARTLAERHFGEWGSGEPGRITFEVRPRYDMARVFIVDRPEAVQSEIRIGHVGVARQHPDYFPILVMNTILGGAFTSRLNLSLRERHGFTYGIRSRFAMHRQPGSFQIDVAVATDVTGAAVREILREVRAFLEQGPSPDELAAARDYLSGVLPLGLQTTEQITDSFAELFIHDLPLDFFARYRDRLAEVRLEDVRRVARDQLRPERFAATVVGDARLVADDITAVDVGPVDVVRSEPAG